MGFRFQKRIKLLPGVTLNIGATGISFTFGVPGANVNVNPKKGVSGSVGIPGTGASYRTKRYKGK